MSARGLIRLLYFIASLLLAVGILCAYFKGMMDIVFTLLMLIHVPIIWVFIIMEYLDEQSMKEWKEIDRQFFKHFK